jgi:P63C domain
MLGAGLAPGILEELKKKNPKLPSGRRMHKRFQWLTEDIGRLREHLASVITLMRASAEWPQFMRMLDRALPRYGDTAQLSLGD